MFCIWVWQQIMRSRWILVLMGTAKDSGVWEGGYVPVTSCLPTKMPRCLCNSFSPCVLMVVMGGIRSLFFSGTTALLVSNLVKLETNRWLLSKSFWLHLPYFSVSSLTFKRLQYHYCYKARIPQNSNVILHYLPMVRNSELLNSWFPKCVHSFLFFFFPCFSLCCSLLA